MCSNRQIFFEKQNEFEKSVDDVHSVKDEMKTTFAETLKQQEEIKNCQKVE